MNSTYKVWYFPGNGRAVNLRAILSHAGATWEDKQIYGDDFTNLQNSGNLEYLALPALEVDGSRWLVQTAAAEFWLARKFNLLGDSADDEYEILNLQGTREDVLKTAMTIVFPNEDQKNRREEIIAELRDVELPFYLQAWEKKYVAKHGKYFLGDNFSLADIFLATLVENVFHLKLAKELGFDALVSKHAPQLAAHLSNLKNNELANFFKSHYNSEAGF